MGRWFLVIRILKDVAIGSIRLKAFMGRHVSSCTGMVLESRLRKVEGINLGVTAYAAEQEVQYEKREGFQYQPDLGKEGKS